MNIDLVDISGEKYILQTVQDITERKKAEAMLHVEIRLSVEDN
ncbi:MAG: hypothetical protein AB1585_04285 [Thermodesulfobacteriota bacterium]